MIKIKRNISSETEKNDEKYFSSCQASLSSDGNITLRNYDYINKNNDEILILSKEETDAIFKLFKILDKKVNSDLPF